MPQGPWSVSSLTTFSETTFFPFPTETLFYFVNYFRLSMVSEDNDYGEECPK